MKQTSLQFFFILSIWIHSYYVRSAGPWTNFYKVQNTRRVFLAYIFPDFTSVTLKQQHSDQFEPLLLRCVFSTALSPWYLFWNIKKIFFLHYVNWHHLLIRGHSTTTLGHNYWIRGHAFYLFWPHKYVDNFYTEHGQKRHFLDQLSIHPFLFVNVVIECPPN